MAWSEKEEECKVLSQQQMFWDAKEEVTKCIYVAVLVPLGDEMELLFPLCKYRYALCALSRLALQSKALIKNFLTV